MGWFSAIMQALGADTGARPPVRQSLLAAQRSRAKIALELTKSDHPTIMTTTIEQVGEEDCVIAQPSVGGVTHPLAFGEALRMSFVLNQDFHQGYTQCLGRIKVPAGATARGSSASGSMLFGYRLALPRSIDVLNRRGFPRAEITLPQAAEAVLYQPRSDLAVKGSLIDVSMSGAQILARLGNRLNSNLEVFLKCRLPEPVGLIDEVVDVTRVTVDQRTGQFHVGVRFLRRIPGLATVIRDVQLAAASGQSRVAV